MDEILTNIFFFYTHEWPTSKNSVLLLKKKKTSCLQSSPSRSLYPCLLLPLWASRLFKQPQKKHLHTPLDCIYWGKGKHSGVLGWIYGGVTAVFNINCSKNFFQHFFFSPVIFATNLKSDPYRFSYFGS